MQIVRESPATALLDGDNGLGIVGGVRAMQEAIRRAGEVGAAVVGVRRSTHFGATAYYAQMAAAAGMVGLALTNAEPAMAPWGGRTRLLGTNPLAIAVPGGVEGGLVLDMATTKVAWGKLQIAARVGQQVPFGLATDLEGQPTTDPQVGMQGLMLPLGDHKGYGLALLITILSATLTGAAHDADILQGQDLGHLFITIDINRFVPLEVFQANLAHLVKTMQESDKLPDVERIYVPGEIEAETMARRRQAGIPLPLDLVADLVALGAEVGVPFEGKEDV
jgi:LDH2 family malate/lactate/ureidoglycolate dehydrogenase